MNRRCRVRRFRGWVWHRWSSLAWFPHCAQGSSFSVRFGTWDAKARPWLKPQKYKIAHAVLLALTATNLSAAGNRLNHFPAPPVAAFPPFYGNVSDFLRTFRHLHHRTFVIAVILAYGLIANCWPGSRLRRPKRPDTSSWSASSAWAAGASAVSSSSNWPGSPLAASSSSSTASTGAFHARPPAPSLGSAFERTTISSPAASICIATATALSGPTRRQGIAATEDIFIPPNEINSRHAGRPGPGRGRTSQSRRPPAGPHRPRPGAPQPHRRRHVSLRAHPGSRLPATSVVIPFDERMTQPILIPPGAEIPPAAESVHAASRPRL